MAGSSLPSYSGNSPSQQSHGIIYSNPSGASCVAMTNSSGIYINLAMLSLAL